MAPRPEFASITIVNGQTVSSAATILRLGEKTMIGLVTPATFDGTAITFQVSVDGTTYVVLNDPITGNPYTVAAALSEAYYFDPSVFLPWNFVKLVAGTVQATTDTVFTAIIRAI
jgi:hypothetical protein